MADQPDQLRKLLESPYDALVEWAAQLGVEWEQVKRETGLKDPNDGRTYRKRMKDNEGQEARQKIVDALSWRERERRHPTAVGRLMLGIEEWRQLGERIARLDPAGFEKRLQVVRDLVAHLESLDEGDSDFRRMK